MYCLTSLNCSGTRMSSCFASASQRPEALIQRTLPSFIDVLPVLACVSSGSPPIRADSSRSGVSRACSAAELSLLIDSPIFTPELTSAVVLKVSSGAAGYRVPANWGSLQMDQLSNSVHLTSAAQKMRPFDEKASLLPGILRTKRGTLVARNQLLAL